MTHGTIIFQKLTIANAPALLELSRKTFFDFFGPLNEPANMEAYASAAFTLQKMEAELNNPNSHFYFAVINGATTGYLKLNFGPAQTEFQDENALEVERIYVSAGHQGKKIGQQLLNFAVETAREQNLQYIWLGVWEHNHNAIGFYEYHGFKTFGNHKFMLGSDQQTDLLMKKELL